MSMRIVIAPDKFKGSCTAKNAAEAIAQGWASVFTEDSFALVPVADGGDGTLEAMQAASGGTLRAATVEGPYGKPVQCQWLQLDEYTAVIEMAQASGLHLVQKADMNIRLATTYGTGQLVNLALDAGCRRFFIGIGGSATNDGGMGLLRALGARFLGDGRELLTPGELMELTDVDLSGFDSRVSQCDITVACDVNNPLCGPDGATAVYGRQKGAVGEDFTFMDNCLKKLAEVAAAKQSMDRSTAAGAGAAGGLGWALMQCCGAKMKPGIDMVLDAAGFDSKLAGADLVITGEGSLDGQSAMGKVPAGIAARAAKFGVPVAAIAGALGEGHEALYGMGISCAIGITARPMALQDAMENAETYIEQAAERLARMVAMGMGMDRKN
jgi:glycerate 2-kinase